MSHVAQNKPRLADGGNMGNLSPSDAVFLLKGEPRKAG